MSHYQETLNRILSHQWEQKPLKLSHVRLFEEFRYRANRWSTVSGTSYKHGGLHPLTIPGIEEEDLETECLAVRQHIKGGGSILKALVVKAVLWSYGEDTGKVPRWALPDPYEPILLFYERGGNILYHSDHGMYRRLVITDNERGFLMRPRFRPGDQYEPLPSLDKVHLDKLDEEPLPEGVTTVW